jgi:actin-related protein
MTEAPLTANPDRAKIVEILFETFNVPSCCVGNEGVLALYGSGRTTGVVLDSGDGVTHAVPVYEGFSMPHATLRLELAGRELTDWMGQLLTESGVDLPSSVLRKIPRDIKERTAYVALDFAAEMQKAATTNECTTVCTLPDGTPITVNNERFRCPELLFNPSSNRFTLKGIDETLVDSITKCVPDVQADMYANIVLSGGSTMFNGLPERLEKEIARRAPEGTLIKVDAQPERTNATWTGGAFLAALPTFSQMLITREEYIETGPEIVHRKCF